jgi:hypothetical protein
MKYFSIKCGPKIILSEYSLKYCSYAKDQSIKLKMERLPSYKQLILFVSSQHVLALIGHQKEILEDIHRSWWTTYEIFVS